MTGRYEDAHRRSLADPEGFWGEAAEAIDWDKRWDTVLDRSQPPFYRWFRGGRLNTCWNALDRHVERGRADQSGAHLRQSRHRPDAELQLSRAARRGGAARRRDRGDGCGQGRPRSHLHADGAGSGDGDARLRAARRHPLGRVRRLRRGGACDAHRRRQAEAHSLRILRRRAQPRRRLQAAPRPGDRAGAVEAARLLHPAAADARGAARAGRDRDWREAVAAAAPDALRRGRGDRSALHPLHLGHDRRAQGHRARQWRPRGGAPLVDGECLWHEAGRGLFRGLRYRLGRGPFLHRLRAAALRLHQHPVRGQAGRHARRRGLLAPHRRARRQRHVHRAHRLPRHQARRSRTAASSTNTISPNSARFSSLASAPTRRPSNGH